MFGNHNDKAMTEPAQGQPISLKLSAWDLGSSSTARPRRNQRLSGCSASHRVSKDGRQRLAVRNVSPANAEHVESEIVPDATVVTCDHSAAVQDGFDADRVASNGGLIQGPAPRCSISDVRVAISLVALNVFAG